MARLLVVQLLLAAAAHADERWVAQDLALLQDQSTGPVAKVAKLLTDMQKTLQNDADDDEELNESMTCWCKANINERTKLIDDNTQKSDTLRSEVQSLREKSNSLSTELEDLNKEVDHNQKALDTAVSLRKQELQEFLNAEKSGMSTIRALNGATEALKKQNLDPKSMVQSEIVMGAESPVAAALRQSMRGHHEILWAIHTEKERKLLTALEAHSRDVDLIQGGKASRAFSAPYELVHGTINSLNDAFQTNLGKLQQDETDSCAAHEAMKLAKKKEINAGSSMIDAKTGNLADVDERASAAREELDDTETALAADHEYLPKVQEQCALHAKEYGTRTATRQEELGALSSAVATLTSDESRDTLTRTFGHTRRGVKHGSRGVHGSSEGQAAVQRSNLGPAQGKSRVQQRVGSLRGAQGDLPIVDQ